MTLFDFNQLTPAEKIRVVVASGTCLARRWQAGGRSLYYLALGPGPGQRFYVEVCYDPSYNSLCVVRSAAGPALLAAYQLPAPATGRP